MIQKPSRQLLKISASNIRLFANDMEELETSIMPESSVAITSSHQVL